MTSLWDWGRFHRNSRYVIVRIRFKRDLLAKQSYSFRYILMLTKLKYLIKDCSSNRRDKSTTYLKTVPQWKYLYLFCVCLNNIQSPLILKNKKMKKTENQSFVSVADTIACKVRNKSNARKVLFVCIPLNILTRKKQRTSAYVLIT